MKININIIDTIWVSAMKYEIILILYRIILVEFLPKNNLFIFGFVMSKGKEKTTILI